MVQISHEYITTGKIILERWKNLVNGCLMSWPKKKCFWSVFFSYSTQQPWTISQSDCDVGWKVGFIWERVTQWLDWEEAPKHFHSQTCANKRSWSPLVVYCPSAPLQLSESRQNHYIWDICSAQKTAVPAASIGQQKGPSSSPWQSPTAHLHNQCFKSWTNLTIRFGLICRVPLACHQLTTTYFKHLNNCFQGKGFHKEQEAEDIFQKFIKFGSTDFYATGINKLISHWQIIYIYR